MNGARETFDEPGVDAVLRDMFCLQYRLTRPVIGLDRVPHWDKVVAPVAPSLSGSGAPTASISGGYIFAVSIAAPDAAERRAARGRADADGADLALFAMIRDAPTGLAGDEFVLPWFIEAGYAATEGPDRDLPRLLGAKRAREIGRLIRKAERSYRLEIHPLGHPDADVTPLARLLRLNARKHGYETPPYDEAVLDRLVHSPLAARMMLVRHVDRATARVVQASLALVDQELGALYQLVQGIDHEAVPKDQNLYVAETVLLYRWGWDRGLRRFNLGRGGAAKKINLGANDFRVLSNLAILTERGAGSREALRGCAVAMAHAVAEELGALRAIARRRAPGARWTCALGAAAGLVPFDPAA